MSDDGYQELPEDDRSDINPEESTVGTGRLGLTEAERQLLVSSWEQMSAQRFRTLRVGAVTSYLVLPAHLEEAARHEGLPRWRIELHGLPGDAPPLGLDICGDVILGRGTGNSGPDLDLDAYYGASAMGVSRRHALLRPSERRLFLIDLESKNGTRCNTIRLGPGNAHALQPNDTVALGKFTFQVKIVDSPAGEESRIERVRFSYLSKLFPQEPDSDS